MFGRGPGQYQDLPRTLPLHFFARLACLARDADFRPALVSRFRLSAHNCPTPLPQEIPGLWTGLPTLAVWGMVAAIPIRSGLTV
jgi:hypothetical protein